jgi:uncharacterized LabA/DUF88 family protein
MDLVTLAKMHFQGLYLFDPEPYGRIFAFVDFANVRKWAKSFWPKENELCLTREIDIDKLSKIIGYVSPVKKFFYYGHYRKDESLPSSHPVNVKHRKSIFRVDKASKAGFTLRTKEIKEISYVDEEGTLGKIRKCNFDIEIAMDMLQKIEKYDTVFLLSGDSDFDILLQYLKSKGKRIITLCARDFVSRELNNHSDRFIPADPFKDHLEYVDHKTNPPKP